MVDLSDSMAPQERTALNAMVDLIMRSDNPEVLCRDVRKRLGAWLDVKQRWHLTIPLDEREAIESVRRTCPSQPPPP